MPVINTPFSEEERDAWRRDPALLKRLQHDPELEANIERFSVAITEPDSEAMHQIEAIVQQNLEQSVHDPELREKLRPSYRAACKRLIYADTFYEAVQRDNVDVAIEDVTQIEETGIRSPDGELREFDIIVLATGFQADRFMRPMTITGRKRQYTGKRLGGAANRLYGRVDPRLPKSVHAERPQWPGGQFLADRDRGYSSGTTFSS